jgi:hypothetical protein
MSLLRVDPYEDLYTLSGVETQIAVKKSDIDAIDYLLRIGGSREDVKTLSDWGVVAKIVEFWSRRWPTEWSEFVGQMKDIKDSRARKDGYSKVKGREGTRYMAAIPLRLMKLIKIIFPNQQWDRTFTNKFMDNIKIVRVGQKIDTWFSIPSAPTHREDIISKLVNSIKADGTSSK